VYDNRESNEEHIADRVFIVLPPPFKASFVGDRLLARKPMHMVPKLLTFFFFNHLYQFRSTLKSVLRLQIIVCAQVLQGVCKFSNRESVFFSLPQANSESVLAKAERSLAIGRRPSSWPTTGVSRTPAGPSSMCTGTFISAIVSQDLTLALEVVRLATKKVMIRVLWRCIIVAVCP